jgi:hypothetical protein
MASRAANFRSTCDSDRALPECSTQAFPAGTPQVGQRTEDICFAVSSLFFILSECDYTHSRESVDLLTSPVLALSYAQKQYGGRRNVRLTYGKIGGHIDRTDTASRTLWREPFVQRFLFVLIVAPATSSFLLTLHTDFQFLAQHGGALVPRDNRQTAASRHL